MEPDLMEIETEPRFAVVPDGEGRYAVRVSTFGGLGDNLFFSAAMGALHEQTDGAVRFDVVAHGFGYPATWYLRFGNPAIWRHQPFIRSVKVQTDIIPVRPENAVGMGGLPFRRLNVDDTPTQQRRMRYVVTHQERQEAFTLLTEAGWRGEPLLGLQLHGGFMLKYWRHLPAQASQARMYGCFVVTVGDEWREELGGYCAPAGPGSLVGKTPSVCMLAALQTWMTAWVGHESGGSYLACAVDCPTLFLCGPDSSKRIMGEYGAHTRWRMVRDEQAASCPTEGRYRCQVQGTLTRPNPVGCACIDAITPLRVWEEVLTLIDYRFYGYTPSGVAATGAMKSVAGLRQWAR